MADRVVVFLDYQNAYRRARGAFCAEGDPHYEGQIDPLALARLVTERSLAKRDLKQLRVYRGLPDSTRDPRAYGAAMRQMARWEKHPLVVVKKRPLRYPPTNVQRPPEEKGIDVQLAVDLISMAIRKEMDVAVVVSVDTDLRPALEAIYDLHLPVRCEVAAWAPKESWRAPKGLTIPQASMWCHRLELSAFRQVADPTDYNLKPGKPQEP